MHAGVQFCKSMIGLTGNAFTDPMVIRTFQQYRFFFLASILCSTPIFKLAKQYLTQKSKVLGQTAELLSVPLYLFYLAWAVSYIMMGSHNPFIYFNF